MFAFPVSPFRTLLHAVSAVALVAGGFVLSGGLGIELHARRDSGADPDTAHVPRLDSTPVPQLIMLYFGSSDCPGAADPDLPKAVAALRTRLAALAGMQQMTFLAIGVALDWSAEKGTRHLRRFGHFDEVAAGAGWGNSVGFEYMWAEPRLVAATPQVVVYRRLLKISADSRVAARYEVIGLEFVAAAAGADRIVRWAESGSALPPNQPERLGEVGPFEGGNPERWRDDHDEEGGT